MRIKSIAALVLVALGVVAAVTVACSSGVSCTAGKLSLQIQFRGTAIYADQVMITSLDPANLGVSQTVTRVSGDNAVMNVDLDFPNGYPTDKVVTLLVRAYGASTLLGENTATIHLDPTCSTGTITIFTSLLDASPTTD
jgi:hypothetical protein